MSMQDIHKAVGLDTESCSFGCSDGAQQLQNDVAVKSRLKKSYEVYKPYNPNIHVI